ncbi:hypothetical protein [Tautonia rosea]|uniref:hypothetical protein n=1 Tax=Tautonia rosea TaxID=2728037 RepID=UPI001474D38B|nr:hypothetical protein [Tautonia rosea]
MPTDGPTVYRVLREWLNEAQNEADRLRAESSRLDSRRRELAAERGRALHELARADLPEMTREAIDHSFEQARSDLLALLDEKQRHEAGLRNRLLQAGDEARRLESRADGLTDRLNALVTRREELEQQVADALKSDADFRKRTELAARAEEDLHRDEQRADELRSEAETKLPAFRSSPLFRYLNDRHYGTPEYTGSGPTRGLDRWVARLINYPRARVAFEFLSRVPALVEAEVASRRDRFEELMDQVDALQQARADELGLTAVLEEGRRLGAERDATVASLEQSRKSADELDRQLAELASLENPYYRRALQRLQESMDRAETAVLRRRAALTPAPRDDELVDRLSRVDAELDRLRHEASSLDGHRSSADRTLEASRELVRRFRSANYDSARSVFSDRLNLERLQAGLVRGSIDFEGAWHSIRTSQQFLPHQLDRGTPGLPGTDVLNSPEARILVEAIGAVLDGATRGSAWRGVERRSGGPRPPSPWSTPGPSSGPRVPVTPRPQSAPRPPRSRPGGFTSGEGF